jgi:hypothetical protein
MVAYKLVYCRAENFLGDKQIDLANKFYIVAPKFYGF